MNRSRRFFFLLTILVGLCYIFTFRDFQYYLSTGDHGRDLYCAQKTLEGKLPFRDYSWLYGPLMPYYYSLFFKIFGVSVLSANLGVHLLVFLTGVVVFFICAEFISLPLSFIAPLWYWAFRDTEFFHTYNHNGALLAILICLLCAVKYIKKQKNKYIFIACGFSFAAMLIRLNIGASTLLAFFLSIIIADFIRQHPSRGKKALCYLLLSCAVSAGCFFIYYYLLQGLPSYVISQCLPYAKEMRADTTNDFFQILKHFGDLLQNYFLINWNTALLTISILVSLIRCLFYMIDYEEEKRGRDTLFILLSTFFIFIIFTLHEYLGSATPSRHIWLRPLVIITILFLYHFAEKRGPKTIFTPTIKASLVILLVSIGILQWGIYLRIAKSYKTPHHFLQAGKIYITNDKDWIETANKAVDYINKNVPKNDKLFTLPMDTLYNFLTQRDQPTRQLAFLLTMRIPEEQERRVIDDIENNNVNWVLISNRAHSTDPAIGHLGITHQILLYRYIKDNFETVATYGPWEKDPGWITGHAVKILKRK
ncbi:MAG: glycosyltransferase family 39 protein [Candidatus Omnitrophica bacterium]|nr:glycosyltransferase family 39 protein [Candidatus Omnitrophota bacterium]